MGADHGKKGQVDYMKFQYECKELKISLSEEDKDILASLFKKGRYIQYEQAVKHLVPFLSKNDDKMSGLAYRIGWTISK